MARIDRAQVLRRSIIGLVTVVGLLLAIVIGVLAWLHTDHGRAWLVAEVHDRVASATGIDVGIEKLEGSLLRTFSIHGIRIAGADSSGSWIACERVAVDWQPWRLLVGQLSVEQLILDSPRIDLLQTPDFPASADTMEADDGPPTLALPFELRLEHLTLDGGALIVNPDLGIDSVRVELSVTARATGDLYGTVELDEVRARWREQVLEVRLHGVVEVLGLLHRIALDGGLEGDLRWSTTPGRLAASFGDGRYAIALDSTLPAGRLASLHEQLGDHPAVTIDLDGAGSFDFETLDQQLELSLESTAGRARVDAQVTGAPLEAEVEVAALDPSQWWSEAAVGSLGCALRAVVADPFAPLDDTGVELRLVPGYAGRLVIDHGRIAARSHGDSLLIDLLEIRATETDLRAAGYWRGLDDLRGEIRAELDNLEVWGEAIGFDLAGVIDLDARVAGEPRGLRAAVELDGNGIESPWLEAAAIDADVTVEGDTAAMQCAGHLRVEEIGILDARIEQLAVSGSASLEHLRLSEFDLAVDATIDSVPGLPEVSAATFEVEAAGRLAADLLSARVARFRLTPRTGEPLIRLEQPVTIERGPSTRLEVRDLALRLPSGALRGTAIYETDNVDVDLFIDEIDLAELSDIARKMPLTGGRIDGRIVLRGNATAVTGTVSFDADDLLYLEYEPIDFGVDVAVDTAGTEVDLAVVAAGDDTLQVSGFVPLRVMAGEPGWEWTSSEFDLRVGAVVDSVIDWLQREKLYGTHAVVNLHLTGPPTSVRLDLDALVEPPTPPKLPRLTFGLEAAVGDGRATARLDGAANDRTVLECQASLPLLLDLVGGVAVDSSTAVEADLKLLDVDLGYARHFLGNQFETIGSLGMHATVAGTLDRPDLTGELRVTGGGISSREFGLSIGDIHLDAEFSQDRIVIREGRGTTSQGTLSIEGTVPTPLTPDEEVDFRLAVTGLEFDTPQVRRVAMDVELAASGPLRHPLLTGRVRVNAATIPIPENRDRKFLELSDEDLGIVPDSTETRSLADEGLPLDLRLVVDIPRNFWIRNRQIQIEIGGNLELSSAAGVLGMHGTLRTIRGNVDFLGQRFVVDRGQVNFIGDQNAELDVDAIYDVDQWRVHILVLGTVEEPLISFESDPPLPEADVLSLIMFGQTSSGLSDSERFTMADRATSMVGAMATAPLEAALSEQLGLDMLRIDAVGDDRNVTVGKYLNPRTMVRVEQSLQKSSEREVTVEYALTDRVQIEVSTDDQGRTGLDFLYKIDR